MTDRLLAWPQVAAMIPFTRQHVYRLEGEGKFPARVQVGPQRVAWRESELLAWMDGLGRGTLPPPPCNRNPKPAPAPELSADLAPPPVRISKRTGEPVRRYPKRSTNGAAKK